MVGFDGGGRAMVRLVARLIIIFTVETDTKTILTLNYHPPIQLASSPPLPIANSRIAMRSMAKPVLAEGKWIINRVRKGEQMNKIQRVVAKNLGCEGGLEYCNADTGSQYLQCRIEAAEAERLKTAEAEKMLSMPSAFSTNNPRQDNTMRQPTYQECCAQAASVQRPALNLFHYPGEQRR